jgi:hypothetical protein
VKGVSQCDPSGLLISVSVYRETVLYINDDRVILLILYTYFSVKRRVVVLFTYQNTVEKHMIKDIYKVTALEKVFRCETDRRKEDVGVEEIFHERWGRSASGPSHPPK